VTARLREGDGCGRLAAWKRSLRFRERDGTGSAVLLPHDGHSDWLSASFRETVVGGRDGQCQFTWAFERLAGRLNVDDRRKIRADPFAVAASGRAAAVDLPDGLQRRRDTL